MKCEVRYYTADNSYIIKTSFIGDSMEEIRKMSRNHAMNLVYGGFKIIGWDYIDIKQDF